MSRLVRSFGWVTVCILVSMASGCAGLQLRERARSARIMIRKARINGAYKCAPRQLALAEAHVEFADGELHQGDYFRAKDHLTLAEDFATQALTKSPPDKCMSGRKQTRGTNVSSLGQSPRDTDGDGILDRDDRCPVEAEDVDGFEDEDGCPEPDNDADGVPDVADKCPLEAEDVDQFEDSDGCPEADNDQDGVPDARDGCPMKPEDADGFEDEDGCPDLDNDQDTLDDLADKCPNEPGPPGTGGCPQVFKHIEVKKDKIELRQKVFFATNNASIQARSYELLEEIAAALDARPKMRIRIEGHTDSRGRKAFNIRLSQQRADSVLAHLIGLGVAPDRLQSMGFGPEQPIETNRTASGRERNRRVEFVIITQ